MTAVDFNPIFESITASFSRGKFEEGDRLLAVNACALPESIRLECRGNRHFYRRELQDAVRCYEAAIRLTPTKVVPRYQYLVGVQEEREGHVVEAFKRYQAAIDAESTFVDPYVELGGLLVKVEDFDGAAQCYRDAIRIEPNNAANYLNLKAVLARLALTNPGRYEAELEALEEELEKVPRESLDQLLEKHHW